ncbi:MAG TPA: CPBP family intramembrane glutamic endopeptidase [Streptosporangiaceae bacterium]|nr:CPBP family intramembrane glutamic endopeptidase [Streptosporangiaceae bacterium]
MADETSTSPREETARPGTATGAGTPAAAAPAPPPPRLMRWEIVAVFAVSLGASGIYALVQYIGSLTAQQAISKQAVVVHGTLAPGRPLLDLFLQLTNITLSLAPVLLVLYLLARGGEGPKTIGLDASQPGQDAAWGALLAAAIGGAGLGLYLIAFHAGVELNVVAENLPDVWWRFPVLVLSAAQNGIYEEVIVVGYLLSRLDKLGVKPGWAIAISATIRGSYHLYQGIGAFFGNAAMGVIFGLFYRRYGRVTPLIIAHTLIDAVTFVGYALLAGHVSWLPAP